MKICLLPGCLIEVPWWFPGGKKKTKKQYDESNHCCNEHNMQHRALLKEANFASLQLTKATNNNPTRGYKKYWYNKEYIDRFCFTGRTDLIK